MKIRIEKNIGKSKLSVEVEGEKDIDALVKASTITSMPDHCTLCNSEKGVELVANKADSFTFIKVRCQNPKCRATSTMGQYKDNSGGFWKEFEVYNPDEKVSSNKSSKDYEEEEEEVEYEKVESLNMSVEMNGN